ncbi:MAG: TonB-dependent receptor [Verrucomicrobia bacterium]|nr:TonB-dependent receptor [Verrucomicrobiota bacterium]
MPATTPTSHRRRGARPVLAGLLALAVVLPARAAEPPEPLSPAELKKLSLEDLHELEIPTVYGASKHEQKTTEAPSAVTIVTREDIQQFGHRTLAEVLRSVRGFYVNSDRGYSFVGLRGVNRPGDYGGGVLLMVNGHRLNDPVADEAFNGTEFPLDVDLIDRVEVIRGPGSALYGNNAFFTVINVLTRKGRDVQNVESSFAAGSFDTYSGRVSVGHRFTNGVELLLSGTYLDSAGHDTLHYPEFSDVNEGRARRLDGQWLGQTFLSLAYREFTLEGLFGYRFKSVPTGAYGSLFNVAPNDLLDERAFLELKHRHEFDSGWLLQSRLYFDHYNYWADEPYDGAEVGRPGEIVLNHDESDTRWWGGEVQASKTLWERHRLTLGVEGRHDMLVHQLNHYVDPRQTVSDLDTPAGSFGFYAQDEFSIRTNLLLNAGVRYDYATTFGDTVNPRAGLIYSPWTPTTFKLLYGQAYRAPNAYEFDFTAPGYYPNHGLKPETIRSYELVWEQRLSRPLRFMAALFYNQIEDQITQIDESSDPDNPRWVFHNIGSIEVKGAEVELEGHWSSGVRGRLSYTYAQATDRDTGGLLSNSPRHVGKFNLAVPLYRDKVFAGLELQALSRRWNDTRDTTTPGFLVANLTLFSHELAKGLEVSASVYNLFDKRYRDPVGPDFTQDFIEQDGRTFRVKLTYRF